MNAGRGARRLIEKLKGSGEIVIRIRADDGGEGEICEGMRHEDGRRLRVLYFVGIFGVCQESELAGNGVFHAGDAMDFQVWVAVENGSQPLRYIAESHLVTLLVCDTRRGGSLVWLATTATAQNPTTEAPVRIRGVVPARMRDASRPLP